MFWFEMMNVNGCLRFLLRNLVVVSLVFLTGCAANQLHGFQNVYYSYSIPDKLVLKVKSNLRAHGLHNAQVERDNVGRLRLTGSYQNEDEVDRAFIIVQSIVGIKSTAPFYPDNVKEKRWEKVANLALARTVVSGAFSSPPSGPSQRRALIIGINKFQDSIHLSDIQGEDDAVLVKSRAEKAGYDVIGLFGENATKINIEKAIEKLKKEIRPHDSLLIYISSHGNPPIPSPSGVNDRKMSIAAFDSGSVNIKDKTAYLLNLQKTSVSDRLVQELAKMPTENTRVIIDTCYSGEILKDIPDDSQRYIISTNSGQPERAGVALSSWTGDAYTAKGIKFTSDESLSTRKVNEQTGYSDHNRTGYLFMTATSENQKSLGPHVSVGWFQSPLSSNKMLKGSFFTQAFFEYLDKYDGHFEPAFSDARRFTEKKALDVSRGLEKQTPRYFSTIPPEKNIL